MKISVLGSEYEIIQRRVEEDCKLNENIVGYCDPSVRRIVVADANDYVGNYDNMEHARKETLRHEIIHAFINESGLAGCSEWATNEEMIDWVAIQFPKLLQCFNCAEAL